MLQQMGYTADDQGGDPVETPAVAEQRHNRLVTDAAQIIEEANQRGISLKSPTEFDAVPGKGLKTLIDGKTVLIGTEKLMGEYNINNG